MRERKKLRSFSKRIGVAAVSLTMMLSLLPGGGVLKAEDGATSYNLSDGLKAYYTFDGDSWDQENRTVKNLAKEGEYDGVLSSHTNAETTAITKGNGMEGNSLHFEGDKAKSFFKIENVINSAEDYTISFWMNIDTGARTDNNGINIVQQTDTGRTLLYLKSKKLGTFTSQQNIDMTQTVNYGEWMNVVISGEKITDTTQSKFTLYVNGDPVIDTSVETSALIDKTTNLLFGHHKDANTGYSFTGDIDTIRIYDKSADQAMVNGLFEEHGSSILYQQLETTKLEAATLLDNGMLDADTKEATALKAALDEAKKLTAESKYAELVHAKEALTQAIADYKLAIQSLPITISIDPSKVTNEIPEYMFGANHRYHMDGYGSWDAKAGQLDPDFKKLSDSASFGSIRYPGGIVSNLFDWKRSIGENRQTTIHGNWDEPSITPNFGVDEAARYIIDDLGGEMIYVYNFGNGSALDAADLVEYLNAEVGENPNGGIDWAQVRADNGHPEPYGVTNFEIGNEVDEGRGYWMQSSPTSWSGSDLSVATMYAEGATRTFTKEPVAEIDNWRTSSKNGRVSKLSSGEPNQVKYMRYANDVTNVADEAEREKRMVKNVEVYVAGTKWNIVDDVKTAGKTNSVQINYENGAIIFGDGINGNIPPKDAGIEVTYTVYKDGLADYYDAMKAVDPNIKIYSGYSNPNIVQAIAQSPKASKDGGKFDGVAVHPYSRTKGQIQDNDKEFYEKILLKIDSSVMSQIKQRKDKLNQYFPDGDKNVCISEYGIFEHHGDVVQSQTHAIYIAENLMRFVREGVAYTNKHCLIDFPEGDVLGPGKQALILAIKDPSGDGYNYYGTPSLETLKIFNLMSATKVVQTDILNNTKFYGDKLNSIDCLSMIDDEGNTYIIAVNMERDSQKEIAIAINGRNLSGVEIQGMKLESDSVDSMNSLANPDNVKAKDFTVTPKEAKLSYTMEPHSIVAFKVAAENAEEEATKLLSVGEMPSVAAFANGTSLADICAELNKNYATVSIETDDPAVNTATVEWTTELADGTYDANVKTAQKFSLKGKLVLPQGVDANNVSLDVRVDIEVKEEPAAEVNKDALWALLNQYDGYKSDAYTAESWSAFYAAYQKASEVAMDDNATQEMVDAAAAELKSAGEALVLAEQGEPSTDPSTEPSKEKPTETVEKPVDTSATSHAPLYGMLFVAAVGATAFFWRRKRAR